MNCHQQLQNQPIWLVRAHAINYCGCVMAKASSKVHFEEANSLNIVKSTLIASFNGL